MKKALQTIVFITFSLICAGGLATGFFDYKGNWMLKIGMALLAFVLIPFFLFYRFDQKQQRKKNAGQDN